MKHTALTLDSHLEPDALSLAQVTCANACDDVYNVYRDMCRALRAHTEIEAASLIEQLRASVELFASAQRVAAGKPVNANADEPA